MGPTKQIVGELSADSHSMSPIENYCCGSAERGSTYSGGGQQLLLSLLLVSSLVRELVL